MIFVFLLLAVGREGKTVLKRYLLVVFVGDLAVLEAQIDFLLREETRLICLVHYRRIAEGAAAKC